MALQSKKCKICGGVFVPRTKNTFVCPNLKCKVENKRIKGLSCRKIKRENIQENCMFCSSPLPKQEDILICQDPKCLEHHSIIKNSDHDLIKEKIQALLEQNKTLIEISQIMNIPLGKNFRQKYTIHWHLRRIQLASILSLACQAIKKYHVLHPELNKRLIRQMREKVEERKKRDPVFAAYLLKKSIERGKLTYARHPRLASEMGKISHIKICQYRENPEYNKNYCASRINGAIAGGKTIGPSAVKIMRKYLTKEILSKGGKKGGPIGGQKAVQRLREKKKILFDGVLYASKLEAACAKRFMKNKIVDKFTDGINCHVKIGYKEFDFFPQQKVFVEFHPIGIFKNTETRDSYYTARRKALDECGHADCPLIVITKLSEFSQKVLSFFEK